MKFSTSQHQLYFSIFIFIIFIDWQNVTPFDFYEEGITGVSYKLIKNCPWVTWIALNAAFHFCWVGMLLLCQLYQVSCMRDERIVHG